jgi:hypothetical protein
MTRSLIITCWLLWFLPAGELRALADTPPAPDGIFGLILIFPVVIAAWRFAGVEANAKERKWRVANGVLLTLCVLFCGAGASGGLLALGGLLYISGYGILRGTQVINRGQGKKRLALGGAIILFALFAVSNYMMSLGRGLSRAEPEAEIALRMIARAEESFRSNATLDQNKNHAGEYRTLDQLIQGGALDQMALTYVRSASYRFVVVLSGDPARDEKEFFAYASPVKYSYEWVGWYSVPGGSIVAALHHTPPRARHTFATDESGVIRQADLGGSRPVTREETRKWEPRR